MTLLPRLHAFLHRYTAFLERHLPGFRSPWFGRVVGQALLIENVWMLHEAKVWWVAAIRVFWAVLIVAMMWHLLRLEDKRYELLSDVLENEHKLIERLAQRLADLPTEETNKSPLEVSVS